jgi:hypothetical protein
MNIPKTMGAQGSPKSSTYPKDMPAAVPPQGRTFARNPRGVSVPKDIGPEQVRAAVRKRLKGVGDLDHARGAGGGSVPVLPSATDGDHARGPGRGTIPVRSSKNDRDHLR